MKSLPRLCSLLLSAACASLVASLPVNAQDSPRRQPPSYAPGVSVAELVASVQEKAHSLQSSSGMREGFKSFLTAHQLQPDAVAYSDYAVIRVLFEATRDAGLWNLHWTITDQPPNSDRIWRQWKSVASPHSTAPTAIAECDELSALYAFLAERAGAKEIGLFWPAANHTVAVWMVHPKDTSPIRVVVPTSQIFLDENDMFDTRKFDPWRQKAIYEYKRQDVPASFVLPRSLADFFLRQIDTYAGASNVTLQRLRYLRDDVFSGTVTPLQAADQALKFRNGPGPQLPKEDLAAFQAFADDMRGASRTH